jgi:hypothetical protein
MSGLKSRTRQDAEEHQLKRQKAHGGRCDATGVRAASVAASNVRRRGATGAREEEEEKKAVEL